MRFKVRARGYKVGATLRELMQGSVWLRRARVGHGARMVKSQIPVESVSKAAEDCRTPRAGAGSQRLNSRKRLGVRRPPFAKLRGFGSVRFVIERYFTFGIFTILPFACGSFGSFTTVTYNSFSPSPNATFVVPSPAAISNTWRSLPSGDSFKILPPNHWAT